MLNDNDQSPMWVYPQDSTDWCKLIVKEFNIHPITAQVLASRGFSRFEDIHSFLYAKLPNLLDPRLFTDMDKAIQRILKALQTKENILVYGDNDVDGISGTALLIEFLRALGANAFYYVPNRTSLKRSLIIDALDYAKANQCHLIITVDCGITAADEINECAKQNVDVIITDHHEPTHRIPHCVATLNPKLINSTYPNRDLTGVGVAFKLAHAFTNHLVSNGMISTSKIDLKHFLDLVALGTVADMGALKGENRILVRYGLKQFHKSNRVGLIKLLEVCELKASKITTTDIASKIAPRLNSLGRIADPQKGVELLLIRDPTAAHELALELENINIERQRIERKDSEDVENYLYSHHAILKQKALVLHSPKWHPGIIPILAARISKQYNRPTVIIAIEDGIGKGSIRTIPEFPLLPTLRQLGGLLINFGGHDFAAGLTIDEKNIEEFKRQFIASVNNTLKADDIHPKLYLDGHADFKDLTFDFLESLSLLEPFGTENPPPILYTNVRQTWPPKIVGKTHLKLYLEQGDRVLEGIGFGLAERRARICKKNIDLNVAFTPHINVFHNKSSIQLQIKDFQTED